MERAARDGADMASVDRRSAEYMTFLACTASDTALPWASTTAALMPSTAQAILAAVAENLHSGLLLLDQQERLACANRRAGELLGCETHELVGESTVDVRARLLARAADPQRAREALDRLWEHSEQEMSTDLALVDAAIRWLRVHSFPIHGAEGRLLGRGLLLEDITLEREAAQARSEALALAAHELKTPLAIIKGCATTLLGSSRRWDAAVQREMLEMIDTQADRLYEILNTLVDVWRLDSGTQTLHLAQVQFEELLRRLVEQRERSAPGHRFILRLPPSLPPVPCDPLRIEQTLNHLLDNAVRYSPGGGTIRLEVEAEGAELRVSITDQGLGIPREHLEHIFQRFYRLPREEAEGEEEGSGLGLAVARATIEAHGGRIWADSPGPGQGATFSFTLPLQATGELLAPGPTAEPLPALTSANAPAHSQGPTLRRERLASVLLAEQDARIARYLRAHLEEQGCQVQLATHSAQFFRLLDLQEPDLILLADLADITALELLRRLREFAETPVIALCTAGHEEEGVRLLDAGADDLVYKPFHLRELLARVRCRLRRRGRESAAEARYQRVFRTGDLVIDYAQHQVFVNGQPVQLSRTEYRLLSTLAQHAGMVMTHELLLEKVWGPEYSREIDFVWVYISRLRRKIEPDPRHPRYILTVPDVGYKLARLSG
ncbi:MAG: winged helix-turn-helix domain-containing protein [Thermogemmatispora sp.]|uniref:ATP-binding protein n=1 Tax=Thermogemmatispora sp. TaxID=1968838 RepID=UPI0019F50855|nr:ATP-binding protein [Thermogemmatispora sp.]MBE3566963.1 winged helix-turn-helix domain-containing protein [Thermogemmatispora sp.]